MEEVKARDDFIVIYEQSEVNAYYDPDGEWLYSMETITGLDGSEVTTEAVLNRPH